MRKFSGLAMVSLACFGISCGALADPLIYVANQSAVYVYDDYPTNAPPPVTVPVGANAVQLAASPDGNTVYAVSAGSNSVAAIATATNTVSATIGVGENPFGIVVFPKSGSSGPNWIYVANVDDGSVSVIDGATNSVVQTISLGAGVRGVAVAPAGDRVYVTRSDTLVAIDTATRTVVGSVAVANGAQRVVVSPDGKTAYVTSTSLPSVEVVDLASLTKTFSVPLLARPQGLVLSADGTRLYVPNDLYARPNTFVTLIDTTASPPAPIDQINIYAEMQGEIFRFGSTLYVPAYSTFSLIDMNVNQLQSRIYISRPVSGFLLGDYGDTVYGVVGGGPGTVTPSVTVAGGNVARLFLNPDPGYQIHSALTNVCGGSLSGNMYTTAPLSTRECQLTVTFDRIPPPTCSAVSHPNGTTDVACVTVADGGTLTVAGATCTAPSGGSGTCSGPTSAVGSAPDVTLALNGGALTVKAAAEFEVLGVVGAGSGSGTITPSVIVAAGAPAVLNVAAASNSQITSVTADTCGGSLAAGTYTTAPVNAACTVSASFALQTFAIDANVKPTGAGSVSCSPNPVPYGGDSTCSATANADYAFAHFNGDCSGTSCSLSNVTATKSVIAMFTPTSITIATAADPAAGGSVACTPNPVPYAGDSTCTASANAGYTFTAFRGDCSGSTCVLSNVTGPRSVTAAFAQQTFPIAASADPTAGGTVVCAPNPVAYGGNSTCTATASPHYTFAGFSGDCSGASCALTNVTALRAVVAKFQLDSISITASANPSAGGTVACVPNPVTYGGSSTCTATPNAQFTFSAFSGACSGTTCTLSNISSPQSVVGNFLLKTFPITTSVTPDGSGTLTCTPNPVDYGSDSSCVASANTGYRFDQFSGDCTGPDCTLHNVTGARGVTAGFGRILSYSGTTSTGTGKATATFSGGGADCRLDTAGTAFIPVSVPYPSAHSEFPHGWFAFRLIGCDTGSRVHVSIVWPQVLPDRYVGYGVQPGSADRTFFAPTGLQIAGNTSQFDVIDGGSGDDEATANGEIVDASGPLLVSSPARIEATPAAGETGLALMFVLLLGLGADRAKSARRSPGEAQR